MKNEKQYLMDSSKINFLKNLNINLNEDKIKLFNLYMRIFLKKNSHVNLISKNDANFLFEKHIFDSLAINLFSNHPTKDFSLLDIGTGGGFPSVPLAIFYNEINVFAIDSIRKKINVIQEIKEELNLTNLFPICQRVEDYSEKFDYITTRAVASLDKILKYAVPNLKKEGYFIAYKSKKISDELKEAKKTINSLGIDLVEVIEYKLPLAESFERNLIIFKK